MHVSRFPLDGLAAAPLMCRAFRPMCRLAAPGRRSIATKRCSCCLCAAGSLMASTYQQLYDYYDLYDPIRPSKRRKKRTVA